MHFSVWLLLALAALSPQVFAQSPPTVSMMPSYNQSLTYGNAAINTPIQVWGRVSGGSGSYGAYSLDFGDGTPVATGTVDNANTTFGVGSKDFIKVDHTTLPAAPRP